MTRKSKLSSAQIESIRTAADRGASLRATARELGVSPGTVTRALARAPKRVRTADEFKGAISVDAPRRTQGPFVWDLQAIRCARDDQMRGHFARPVRLAEAMRTDDALFTAYHNRLAALVSIPAKLVACAGSRGETVERTARTSVICPTSVLESIHGTLVNHGVAIGRITQTPNEDGTRVDFRLDEWPLEWVRYNISTERLQTATRNGPTVDIVHGDGAWIVFRKLDVLPWTQDACILPGALIWAAHANAIRDWAASSFAHGNAKVLAQLPEGWAIRDGDGNVTPEVAAFLQMLREVLSGEAAAGIQPFGAETTILANDSTMWQVFAELAQSREKAAARIYQGTDATLGSVGGAPGVNIAVLFGVATTRVQGDIRALEQGLSSGLFEPWTAINYGDSSYAPALRYQLPDPDAEAKAEDAFTARDRLNALLKGMREQQLEVTQETVDALAAELGVHPVPKLASGDTKRVPLTLAPTDLAKVVRVGEARQSQGLDLLGTPQDNLTIAQLDAATAKPVQTPGITPPPAPAVTPEPRNTP